MLQIGRDELRKYCEKPVGRRMLRIKWPAPHLDGAEVVVVGEVDIVSQYSCSGMSETASNVNQAVLTVCIVVHVTERTTEVMEVDMLKIRAYCLEQLANRVWVVHGMEFELTHIRMRLEVH
jgi:hypothetical protein